MDQDITVVVSPEVVITTTVAENTFTVTETAEQVVSAIVSEDPEVVATVTQDPPAVVTVLSIGPPGPKGEQGIQGIQGPKGDGFSIDASGPPEDKTLYDGEIAGFAFLDTTNSLLYIKNTATSGDWSSPVVFGKGEKGDPGDDGNTVLYGTIDPTVSDGVDGNFYINTASNYIFGPKNGTWPAGTSLVGPPGNPGNNGLPGDPGEDGAPGAPFTIDAVDVFANRTLYDGETPGFAFLASDTSMLYILLAPSAWSVGVLFGKGDPGDPGEQGEQGEQGPQGLQGLDGASYTGPEIYAQMTEPVGVPDGTIWIDTSQ